MATPLTKIVVCYFESHKRCDKSQNCMKYLLMLFFCFSTLLSKGQDVIVLDKVSNTDNVRDNKSIIYGNFIQRLGFSSGGFPQDIIIHNIDTKEFFKFRVKPTFKSKKENQFCVHINPGDYIIVNYLWTQSKWYGGTMYGEQPNKHCYEQSCTSKLFCKSNTK